MEKRRMEFEVLAKLSLFQTAAAKYSYTLNLMDTVHVVTETDRWVSIIIIINNGMEYSSFDGHWLLVLIVVHVANWGRQRIRY